MDDVTLCLRILLVEDSPIAARLITALLKDDKDDDEYQLHHVQTLGEAMEHAETAVLDVVLLDLGLPDSNGLDTLGSMRSRFKKLPIIILTSNEEKQLGIDAIRMGAQDFLVKGFVSRDLLVRSLHYSIERKKAEIILAESEDRFKTIIEKNADGILVLDMAGIIQYVNPAGEFLLRRDEHALVGTRYGFEVNTEDALEITIPRGDHEPVIAEQRVVGITWESRPHHLVSLRNISYRKMMELMTQKLNEELLQMNATKDKFFSIIAHDLRAPFQGLMGYSELLAMGNSSMSDDERLEMIQCISELSVQTYQLLDNLLKWSRLQSGRTQVQMENLHLSMELTPTIDLLRQTAAQKDISVSCLIDESICVRADRNMIATIVRNIASNGIKFTRNGGAITIAATRMGGLVQVSISDTGVGMDPEVLATLFHIDKTKSTKGTNDEKGSGLGLVLCKDMVALHGQRIWVESEVGVGSVFRFTLEAVG